MELFNDFDYIAVIVISGMFILLVGWALRVCYQRGTQGTTVANTAAWPSSKRETEDPEQAALRRRLLSITLGDARRVDWLVSLERRRQPGADQATLMRAAIDRWEQDNRSWR
jgi:hypothetical protein